MDIQSFITNFAEAIDGLEPDGLTAQTAFRELEQWDSLAFLSVLAMIDGEYGVELPGDELLACANLGELCQAVAAKQ
ncbi:acyl carrier protein [Ruficoccus amylovorans]|uniref:Acyl carrier protein n=1 Tax=Ruficoccus amylovorans TaxID=1804625 RepID=A0A842HD24_9BACT|nr:acyl carrier protein [Ruficoccus amylovorans]MBC2594322.1 acyl carrier protein [Ruficoccus amylovorans]